MALSCGMRESVQVDVHRCGQVALGAVQVTCPQGGRPAVVGHDDGHDLGPGHPQRGQRVRARPADNAAPPPPPPSRRRSGRAPTRSDPAAPARARPGGQTRRRLRLGPRLINAAASASDPRATRARASAPASSGCPPSTVRGILANVCSSARPRPATMSVRAWVPARSAARGQSSPATAERMASSGMALLRNHSAARRCRSRRLRRGTGRARRMSEISRCSRYQRPGWPTACTNRCDAARSASTRAPSCPSGERIGEIGAHEVDDADRLQEGDQLGRLPVQHLGQQVAGHAVVLAAEHLDRGREVVHCLQVHRDQAQPGGPALRAFHQPLAAGVRSRRPAAA